MKIAIEQEIERFLHTGQRDVLSAAWPGHATAAPAPVAVQAQAATSPPQSQEPMTALAMKSTVESDPAPVNQANDAPAPEASARR